MAAALCRACAPARTTPPLPGVSHHALMFDFDDSWPGADEKGA